MPFSKQEIDDIFSKAMREDPLYTIENWCFISSETTTKLMIEHLIRNLIRGYSNSIDF